jgi:hypothetical protein
MEFVPRCAAVPCLLLTLATVAIAAAQSHSGLPESPAPQIIPVHNPSPAPDQTHQSTPATSPADPASELTIFPHPDNTRWYIGGQANGIGQAHPNFHSPYEGPNSFRAGGEYKASYVGTLYTGFQPHRNLRYNTDFLVDVESTGGRGLSQAFGLAGFTNLDVVRNPNLGPTPYLARGEIHQTIGLTNEMTESDRTYLGLATQVPVRRFDRLLARTSA